MPQSKITYWEMVKALNGSFSDWRRACEKAKASGWTFAQVDRIIFLWSPITLLLVIFAIVLIIAVLTSPWKGA